MTERRPVGGGERGKTKKEASEKASRSGLQSTLGIYGETEGGVDGTQRKPQEGFLNLLLGEYIYIYIYKS